MISPNGSDLQTFLTHNSIGFVLDAEIKKIHWLKIGNGKAEIAIFPDSKRKFVDVIGWLKGKGAEFLILGNGSNCYFTNSANIPILVITTKLREICFENDQIYTDVGVPLASFAKECVAKGLDGFAGLVGVPGTVGAAARNNSGSYFDCEMSRIVRSVEIIDEKGDVRTLSNAEMAYAHRSSIIKRAELNAVIIGVNFEMRRQSDPKAIKELAEKAIQRRLTEQEVRNKNLGSIFVSRELWPGMQKKKYLRFKVYNFIVWVANFLLKRFKVNVRLPKTGLFLLMFLRPDLVKNVSPKTINCFVWKENALNDDVFFSYLTFMKRLSGATVEIEVFDKSVHALNMQCFDGNKNEK